LYELNIKKKGTEKKLIDCNGAQSAWGRKIFEQKRNAGMRLQGACGRFHHRIREKEEKKLENFLASPPIRKLILKEQRRKKSQKKGGNRRLK